MRDIIRVQIGKSSEELVNNPGDIFLRDALGPFGLNQGVDVATFVKRQNEL